MASKQQTNAAKPLPPNAGKGRKPGTLNKTTTALKDAILLAAETVGEDGKGKAGLTGYLKQLAQREPKAFSALLGRVLPLQVQGAGPNGEHTFGKIIVEVVDPKR